MLLAIKTLDDQITELKRFNNLGHNTERFLTIVDTIPPEFKFYYEDGLHFGNVGLSKSCSILLSNLYRAFAPLLIITDVNTLELVVDAGNVKLASVH